MTRIAIIDGHPDADPHRFVHALADAYAEGAASHECRRIDVAKLDFPLIRSAEVWRDQAAPKDIAEAQELVRWAEHLVVLYPLWLGDMPALLKAFLEQLARPGFAFEHGPRGFPRKLLKGRSARVIVTMGMPAPFYSLFYRAHSLKSLERNILSFVGIGPVRHSIIGSVESGPGQRGKWLARIRRMGVEAR